MSDLVQLPGHRNGEPMADIAYRILKDRHEPMKYKDLVKEVLSQKGVLPGQTQSRIMAKAHTEISMDSRFHNRGGGMCGLREWTIRPSLYKVVQVTNVERPKPGDRLRRELTVLDEDYQEESQEEEPVGEPDEPEEG